MSRFDERFLEELQGRLRVSDVIGRSVKLKRQGREWVGLSPFGKERTPSFFVNDEKGRFFDFSSGKSGDLIGFLQETERLSFREAVERLAAEAGLALPAPDPRAAEQEQRRQGLSDWLAEAQRWFSAQLRRPPGEAARRYLDTRRLPPDQWERFGLGFAPAGRTGLKDHLVAKGARPAELVEAGLLIQPDDGSAPYDRFRDRIIFPIADARGRVVSFGGRALDPQARAKYLNGPETPVFHKGAVLYGLHEARRLLHAAEARGAKGAGEGAPPLVVVEGYMDVIACQRADIPAVASMGTALGEEQMEALWRTAPEPVLAFDADPAGQRAAHRALDRALPLLRPGRSFRFAAAAGGKDADDVLREQGAAALRAQLSASRPFVEVLFEREQQAEPLETPEAYAGLKARLRKLAAAIADRDLSQMYREALLDRFEALRTLSRPAVTASGAGRALAEIRWSRGKGDRRPRPPVRNDATPEVIAARRRSSEAPPPLAAALAQGLLQHPELIDDRFETLDVQGFCDPGLQELARDLIQLRLAADALEPVALHAALVQRGHAERLERVGWAAARSAAPFLRAGAAAAEVRALWSQAYGLLLRVTALNRALGEATSEMVRDADLEREPDFLTYYRLKAERDAVERAIASGSYVLEDDPGSGAALLH